MNLRSWGNYPKIESNILPFDDDAALRRIINDHDGLIPYGNGRSYGDSALSENIIHARPRNLFLNFDESGGFLHVQAGVLLSEILDVFVPRGWFLEITPGTKSITVGGAVAADVHGKNHHLEGCFSESVTMFRLALPDGRVVRCSRRENPELFRATCGGMGLTGVVLDAEISLKKIGSKHIRQTTVKTKNLEEVFECFERYQHMSYSVAWIDCLATGDSMGRSLLTAGYFSDDGDLDYRAEKKKSIPIYFPPNALNRLSVRTFNFLYYHRIRERISEKKVDIDTFFYPLDAVANWNRIYGKNGFTQYQFVLPEEESLAGMREILKTISAAGKGSFLGVLKRFGKANDNYLSFPMAGYTLALDFKIEKGIFAFLSELDGIVLNHGGRIYLAKDVRVSRSVFQRGYPGIDRFRDIRKQYGMRGKFDSLQSRRVGI